MNNNNPVIILSSTSPVFLERLFESEVPEVYDGLISIRNIVRVPVNEQSWPWNPTMTVSTRLVPASG
jgi:transcription antitermination factor NusA-like protein